MLVLKERILTTLPALPKNIPSDVKSINIFVGTNSQPDKKFKGGKFGPIEDFPIFGRAFNLKKFISEMTFPKDDKEFALEMNKAISDSLKLFGGSFEAAGVKENPESDDPSQINHRFYIRTKMPTVKGEYIIMSFVYNSWAY